MFTRVHTSCSDPSPILLQTCLHPCSSW